MRTVYTALNLLTVYHDYILDRYRQRRDVANVYARRAQSVFSVLTCHLLPRSSLSCLRARAVTCELRCGPRQRTTQHRYAAYCVSASCPLIPSCSTLAALFAFAAETATVQHLQNLLLFLHYTEVLMEMATTVLTAGRTAEERRKVKWTLIAVIEGTKAAARLYMLWNNNGRMLVPPSQDELNMQIIATQQQRNAAAASAASSSSSSSSSSPPPHNDLVSLYLSHGRNTLHPHGKLSLPPSSLPAPATNTTALSEALYIVRPLVYVVLRYHYPSSSYTPFISSLFIDLLSRALAPQWQRLTAEERAEVGRRCLQWSLYLLRSPVFEEYSQWPLVRVSQLLSRVPLVGLFFSNMLDLVFSLQQHYFYTSAS
jgi:hypothetical protein